MHKLGAEQLVCYELSVLFLQSCLKVRLSNNVVKSCKTPVMKVQKIVWSITRAATTVLLGSIDALFHEFSEPFGIFNFHQKCCRYILIWRWQFCNSFTFPLHSLYVFLYIYKGKVKEFQNCQLQYKISQQKFGKI